MQCDGFEVETAAQVDSGNQVLQLWDDARSGAARLARRSRRCCWGSTILLLSVWSAVDVAIAICLRLDVGRRRVQVLVGSRIAE
jgi:hypothetical protein